MSSKGIRLHLIERFWNIGKMLSEKDRMLDSGTQECICGIEVVSFAANIVSWKREERV